MAFSSSYNRTVSLLNQRAIEENRKELSIIEIYHVNHKINVVENTCVEYKKQLDTLFVEFKKIKMAVDNLANKNKQQRKNLVEKHADLIDKKSEKLEVTDSLLSNKRIKDQDKILTYVNAINLISQKKYDFINYKETIIRNSQIFEDFYKFLKSKVIYMLQCSPEGFRKCSSENRKYAVLNVMLTKKDCELQQKCHQIFYDIVRDYNFLQIVYGLPEKPELDDLNKLEKNFTQYKSVRDKLGYDVC